MNLRTIGRGLVALARKLMFWRRPAPEPVWFEGCQLDVMRRSSLAVINRDFDAQLMRALASEQENMVGRKP